MGASCSCETSTNVPRQLDTDKNSYSHKKRSNIDNRSENKRRTNKRTSSNSKNKKNCNKITKRSNINNNANNNSNLVSNQIEYQRTLNYVNISSVGSCSPSNQYHSNSQPISHSQQLQPLQLRQIQSSPLWYSTQFQQGSKHNMKTNTGINTDTNISHGKSPNNHMMTTQMTIPSMNNKSTSLPLVVALTPPNTTTQRNFMYGNGNGTNNSNNISPNTRIYNDNNSNNLTPNGVHAGLGVLNTMQTNQYGFPVFPPLPTQVRQSQPSSTQKSHSLRVNRHSNRSEASHMSQYGNLIRNTENDPNINNTYENINYNQNQRRWSRSSTASSVNDVNGVNNNNNNDNNNGQRRRPQTARQTARQTTTHMETKLKLKKCQSEINLDKPETPFTPHLFRYKSKDKWDEETVNNELDNMQYFFNITQKHETLREKHNKQGFLTQKDEKEYLTLKLQINDATEDTNDNISPIDSLKRNTLDIDAFESGDYITTDNDGYNYDNFDAAQSVTSATSSRSSRSKQSGSNSIENEANIKETVEPI